MNDARTKTMDILESLENGVLRAMVAGYQISSCIIVWSSGEPGYIIEEKVECKTRMKRLQER